MIRADYTRSLRAIRMSRERKRQHVRDAISALAFYIFFYLLVDVSLHAASLSSNLHTGWLGASSSTLIQSHDLDIRLCPDDQYITGLSTRP